MKTRLSYFFALLVGALLCACTNREVKFVYSPAAPRAGEKITFSNLTEEGEEWLWSFGDGATTTQKSPTRAYKHPGTYVVTLMADKKENRKCSKEITIYDTVPTFAVQADSIFYRRPVTFEAVLYNPFGREVQYHWHLPACAVLTKGDTTSASFTAYFTEKEKEIKVALSLTLNTVTTDIEHTYYLYDTPAPSLLMVQNKHLYRQRLYENGMEEPTLWAAATPALTAPNTLLLAQNQLYILNADASAEGAITVFDLTHETVQTVIKNAEANPALGYFAGFLEQNKLYWGCGLGIACIDGEQRQALFAPENSPYLLVPFASTGLKSGQMVGLDKCGDLWFCSTGQGIARFTKAWEKLTPLAENQPITSFAIDAFARKVYFVSQNQLFICNADGSSLRLLCEDATGALSVNVLQGYLCFAQANGVAFLPLVQTQNNQTTASPFSLNRLSAVSALVLDPTVR